MNRMVQGKVYYGRYMDNMGVLNRSRWQLPRAVRMLNWTFAELDLAQDYEKTIIGRIEREFDFLGYHFSRGPIWLVVPTIQYFVARLRRLYE